ncbi:MAG: hypothetical protein U0792_20240 [Gemmataceae bacterium]
MPAAGNFVTATLSGGTLKIVANDSSSAPENDNNITVYQFPEGDTVYTYVEGNGTEVRGGPGFTNVKNIDIRMNRGYDIVHIEGVQLDGTLSINQGSGGGETYITDGGGQGLIGPSIVFGKTGSNIKGLTTVTGTEGADLLVVLGSTFGAFTANLKAGNDEVDINGSTFTAPLLLNTDKGNDDVYIDSGEFSYFYGASQFGFPNVLSVTVSLGDGDDYLLIGDTSSSNFLGVAIFGGGNGIDYYDYYNSGAPAAVGFGGFENGLKPR